MSDDQNSSESPTFSNRGRGRGRGRRRSRGRGNRSRHQNPRENAPRANALTINDSSSSQTIPADADSVIPTLTFVSSRISSDATPPSKLTLSSLSISNDKQTSSTSASSVNKNKYSSRNQRQFRKNNPVLQTKDLIQELVFFQGFSTDIATLSRNFNRDAMEVEARINKHKGIFSTTMGNLSNKLLVKLDPKIKFCSNYIESTGCHKKNCLDIHTCHYNLFDSCHEKTCMLEHNLNSRHNNRILYDFYLEDLSTSSLKDILKQIIQGSVYPRVCFSYQNEFCEAGQNCKHLHICYQLVLSLGTCPNMDNCSLNHNIHDPFCIAIFNRFNIPTNESPRDLLKLLVNKLEQTGSDIIPRRMEKKSINQDKYDSDWSNCSSEVSSVNSTRYSIQASPSSKFKENGRGGYCKKEQLKDYKLEKDNCETNQLYCDAISIAKTSTSNANLSKTQKQNEIQSAKSYPVCDWKIKGDVDSPYICIPNLHGKCEDIKTVCKYLHSKRTYQWQFGDKKWFNFHSFHTEIIERHFRDVSCNAVTLPAINPSLCFFMKDMPRILGTFPLKVDFTRMTLSGEYLTDIFLIRHLTITSTAIDNDKFSTIFNWFFKNDEDKWQLYETNDNCEVSSDHIEKAYLSDSNVFNFKDKNFTYTLNFSVMIQVNESTRKIRAIRRRPKAFPNNESSFDDKAANLSKSQKQNQIPTAKSYPVCDWKIEGDVESPYICIPNLHLKCEDIKTVCKYLHSKRTYQWQFGDKKWFNFHAFHTDIIERHFRDVSCNSVTLPAINPSLCFFMKDMPRILGTLPLKVDFTRMTLSGKYLTDIFLIRHLTTTSTAINNDKYSTIFNWFFKNDEDKWQLYETNDNCEVSSDHIEKAYLSDLNVFNFKDKNFTYTLNFSVMIQVNESTRKIRAIRRRPKAFPNNESLFADKAANLSKSQKQNEISTAKSFPVYDWKIKGDVESPYICIPNLHGKCEDMKTVCKYLHSKRTYQWQFGDKNWFNLHAFHADIIERHFRDASCDEVTLPVINPNLCTSMKDMPRILGTSPLKIDFTKMTLSGDYLKETFLIRHLTTTSTAINNDKFSTIFNWFFKNDEDKWQLYETNDNCEVSSDHIEKAYLSDSNVFNFKGKKFTYTLTFSVMIQVNESTRKIRAIRRRPRAFPYNESLFADKASLPKNWNGANSSKGYNLISLNDTEAEYMEVRKLFKIKTENYKIPGIFRVQNELLWRQFDNKKNELKAKYPQQVLDVQKLFHCVDDEHFEEVCKENLDFRIHNESAEKKFGQGAYFFSSASNAYKFCDAGIKKILLFDVIVGQTVKGDPSLTRPPENDVYNALYDTTVDDVSCPTTFVKYNKHEYYPSYAVVLQNIKSGSSP